MLVKNVLSSVEVPGQFSRCKAEFTDDTPEIPVHEQSEPDPFWARRDPDGPLLRRRNKENGTKAG